MSKSVISRSKNMQLNFWATSKFSLLKDIPLTLPPTVPKSAHCPTLCIYIIILGGKLSHVMLSNFTFPYHECFWECLYFYVYSVTACPYSYWKINILFNFFTSFTSVDEQ